MKMVNSAMQEALQQLQNFNAAQNFNQQIIKLAGGSKSNPSSNINPSQNPVSQSATGNSNQVNSNSALDNSKKSGFMQSFSASGNGSNDYDHNSGDQNNRST